MQVVKMKSMRGADSQSKPNKKLLSVAAGVLLALGVLNGASVWGAFYYVIFGGLAYWVSVSIKAVLKVPTTVHQPTGFISFSRQVLQRMDGAIFDKVGWGIMGSPFLQSSELYRNGFFRLGILMLVCAHLYTAGISVLDYLLPAVAQWWFDLTAPLVNLLTQYSYGHSTMSEALVNNGYAHRLDFLSHLYIAPAYISILVIIFGSAQLAKRFRIEVKSHLFYHMWLFGPGELMRSVRHYLYCYSAKQIIITIIFLPIFNYAVIFAAVPLDIFSHTTTRRVLLSAYESRMDMQLFATLTPVIMLMNLYVIKMLIAHGVMISRLLHRKRTSSPQR